MIIKNTTGTKGNAAKVVGIGPIWLQPDEEKIIPDSFLYVNELDDEGRETGKKVILPAIKTQERLGMIELKETVKPAATPAVPVEPETAAEAPAETAAKEPAEEKKTTRRSKKAE